MRKKLTPLQKFSLAERNTATTTVGEELQAGLVAFANLQSTNDKEYWTLVTLYSVLWAKIQVEVGMPNETRLRADLKRTSDKLFKRAHSLGVFTDTRILISALAQSIEYLAENQNGEFAPLAIELIEKLNQPRSYGSIPSTHTSSLPSWLFGVVILLILNVVHR